MQGVIVLMVGSSLLMCLLLRLVCGRVLASLVQLRI